MVPGHLPLCLLVINQQAFYNSKAKYEGLEVSEAKKLNKLSRTQTLSTQAIEFLLDGN